MGEWRGGDGASRGTGVWPLYVGLFVVLLAFFIMLVSTSRPDSGKTSAVVDSLQTTFATRAGSTQDDEGLFAPGASALTELGGDLAGLLRVAHVRRAAGGQELRVTVPASELFSAETAEVRETCLPFIDRVVATLAAPPSGVRLELAFSLGARPATAASGRKAGDELALAVRRGGAFARALVARGAPPAVVAIGLDPGHPGQALLAFRDSAFKPAAQGAADKWRE